MDKSTKSAREFYIRIVNNERKQIETKIRKFTGNKNVCIDFSTLNYQVAENIRYDIICDLFKNRNTEK